MQKAILAIIAIVISTASMAAGPNFGEGTITAGGGSKPVVNTQCTTSGTSVPLTISNTPYDVTSLSIPAGEWNVSGSVFYIPGAGATTTSATGWLTTTSATLPAFPNAGGLMQWKGSYAATADMGYPVGTRHFSLSVPTTIYLGTRSVFTGGTMNAYGCIVVH